MQCVLDFFVESHRLQLKSCCPVCVVDIRMMRFDFGSPVCANLIVTNWILSFTGRMSTFNSDMFAICRTYTYNFGDIEIIGGKSHKTSVNPGLYPVLKFERIGPITTRFTLDFLPLYAWSVVISGSDAKRILDLLTNIL